MAAVQERRTSPPWKSSWWAKADNKLVKSQPCRLVVKGHVTCACVQGFPYSYELNIFSHVTLALSLTCFLMTILSYALFR
jgi:hypothetical protein